MTRQRERRWAGVDVGGHGKGFDVAVVNRGGLVSRPRRLKSATAVVDWLRPKSPELVAVDSPRAPAPQGARARQCERDLSREVCGIRWTPDRAALDLGGAYYDWVRNGLELYSALHKAGLVAIEVFPTAAWTRWGGPRDASRAAWSRRVLAELGLEGLPARLNQDARDAVAAALTARLYDEGNAQCFGPIVVPAEDSKALI